MNGPDSRGGVLQRKKKETWVTVVRGPHDDVSHVDIVFYLTLASLGQRLTK
jgi:hypothetical protein